MSTELNKLFEQIFRSERQSKVKSEYLKRLRSRIQEIRFELQQEEGEISSKEGELAVKNNKLFEIEVEVKFLKESDLIQRDLSQSIRKLNNELQTELETKMNDHQALYKLGVYQLTEFSCSYDMQMWGYTKRQEDTKSKVTLLCEEQVFLDTEMVKEAAQRDQYQAVYRDTSELKEKVSQDKIKLEELLRVLKKQETEVENLVQERLVSQNVCNDLEFSRLQKELEVSKNCLEESECASLRKQLEYLQRQCYHKQMQQHVPHTSDAVKRDTGCMFQHMPIALPVFSQNSADVAQKMSFETNAQDTTQLFIEDELLTEQCLEMFADSEDDDCLSWTENDNVGDMAVIDIVKRDGSDLSVQEKTPHVSMKNNCMHLSPKQPTNVHLHFKHRFHQISDVFSSSNATTNPHIDVISPEPSHSLRKRPGQSIYKAPGAQTRFVKRTKKVRFNH